MGLWLKSGFGGLGAVLGTLEFTHRGPLVISLCPKKFKNPHIPTLFEQYMLVDEIPAIIKLIKSKLSQRF